MTKPIKLMTDDEIIQALYWRRYALWYGDSSAKTEIEKLDAEFKSRHTN